MSKIINTANYGLYELHARYNAKHNVATFDKYAVYRNQPPFRMGSIELTKEDLHFMLKYFYDVDLELEQIKKGKRMMIDYKVTFSVAHDFEGVNELTTAQGNIDSIVITTSDGQTMVLNDVESFEIVEAVKVDIDEDKDQRLI
ncbi:hypothetical protein R6U77_12695 [Lysinibacillus louembei]|uniref:Uncharacterized protein n=1 Tax=Lysinibacillus louembei TaxID=1470088 RepID=A0ABZ0RR91_9BACI|nr:hypothetical protein [Lysinibacillus louembei]WPK10738.1 hypothetical protein R6U77_12695 [Lysinibacillus louembei]